MGHPAPSREGVRRNNHGRSFDRRDVWVGLKPTARFTNEPCLSGPINKTAKETEEKTLLSESRSLLKKCLTGPTLLEMSGRRRVINFLEDCKTRAYICCMLPRGLLPVAPLLLACLPCAFGQLPRRLEKCLPYPTLAQEIREMQPAAAQVRVHVTRVEFDPNDDVPADAQEEISAELRRCVFKPDADSAYQKDLAKEIAEVPVREVPGKWRNRTSAAP